MNFTFEENSASKLVFSCASRSARYVSFRVHRIGRRVVILRVNSSSIVLSVFFVFCQGVRFAFEVRSIGLYCIRRAVIFDYLSVLFYHGTFSSVNHVTFCCYPTCFLRWIFSREQLRRVVSTQFTYASFSNGSSKYFALRYFMCFSRDVKESLFYRRSF